MTRIPDAELDRLKREVSLVRLVEARGIKIKGQGDNLLGLCPFHDDHDPSLVISPSMNIWHCLGACQAGGSVIDWVMRAEKVSFRQAVELLQKQSPSLVAPVPLPNTKRKLEPIAEPSEADETVLKRVADFYYRTLKNGGGEAISYVDGRGLNSSELIDAFKLGYANRTLGYRVPERQVKVGASIREQLIRLGVLRGSGHEHFTGSLVIPVFGRDGEVLEMYGRKVRNDLRKGTPNHLYLPRRADGRRGVFNLAGLNAEREVVLCEALIDALTFWAGNIRNVTSAYGVEGFTAEMLEAFAEQRITKVLIAYDRDEAGDRAAEKLAPELAKHGLEVFRVLFPKGMDANEYARKVQPASKSLAAAVNSAQWMAGTRPVSVPAALEEPPHDPITGEVLEPKAESPSLVAASEPTPLPASPSPAPELAFEHAQNEIRLQLGDRRWRIRGLRTDVPEAALRLNVLVARGDAYFVDTLKLYDARQRAVFVKQAAEDLRCDELVLKADLGKLLLELEALIDRTRAAAENTKAAVTMTEEARAEALALLKDPRLLERLIEDFDRAGVVGEESNKLLAYLATVSRKLEAPLAVVLQSSSAAGKSSLMDAVLRFVPEEERVHFSAMTGQSLFYMGETDLSHKILAIAEEQGAQSAAYALKLLQSDGVLTIASTGKNPTTGRLVTHPYRVKGPVMIFMTTTAIEVDEELLNRCLVLTVDEGAEQTAAIHERQREAQTIEGLLARRESDHLITLYQNAQRLLEPLLVANPFAKGLRFDHRRTRARRDHLKYLTLIRCVAFLHQHQRPIKTVSHRGQTLRYIEVTARDIAVADRLAKAVLGERDEMPAHTRRLLAEIEGLVSARAEAEGIEPAHVRFTRRDIREHTRLSHTQISVHMQRLEALEYLLVHGGGGKRRALYELASPPYDRDFAGGEPDLQGLKAVLQGVCRPLAGGGGLQEKRSDLGDLATKIDLEGPFGKAHLEQAEKVVPNPKPNGHTRTARTAE